MSKQDINQEFNTFVGGILTEANPINFPVGYTLDEENFILQRNGIRRRRWGLDYEDSHVNSQYFKRGIVNNISFDKTYWGEDRFVLCEGEFVYYYDIDTDSTISPGTYVYGGKPSCVADHNDYLFVVERESASSYRNFGGGYFNFNTHGMRIYDRANTLVDTVFIEIRDFETIDDGTSNTNRPLVMTNEHYYNLFNRGWTDVNITAFFAAIGAYPSRADNMNSGLDAATGVFNPSWVNLANNGDASAPTGHYPIKLFLSGKSRVDGLVGSKPTVISPLTTPGTGTGEIVDMLSFAGRMFYLCNLGQGPIGKTLLTYSRAGVSINDIGKCYQTNDPTSRDYNIPLDTDGGHLDISEVGTAYKIVSLKSSIFIFGSNGVYEVFSRDGLFRPVSIGLRKITNDAVFIPDDYTGIANASSITLANDTIFYFARSGVMQIVYDSSSGLFIAVNISSDKIQTLYNSLGETGRAKAEGIYIASDNTVRFLLNESNSSTILKNIELVYDIVLKAWYKNRFVPTSGFLVGKLYPVISFVAKTTTQQSDYPVDDLLRYICVEQEISNSYYIICKYKDGDFNDFNSSPSPSSIPAFMQTGYINAGDSQRFKQTNYIVPSFIRTEDGFTDDGAGNLTPTNESSCIISAWWDYADDETYPKVNPSFEAYRYNRLYIPSGPADTFNYGQSVITTKNRLTGRGRALSLRFESSPGKDCRLLGWGMDLGVQTKV